MNSPPDDPAQRRWLVLRFEAPMLSFGGVAIDQHGVTWDFPGLSMLTGLFANALGWHRTDCEAHQVLQDRIVFAARREHEPYRGAFRDVQNAQLQSSDKGWTTRGQPEGRDGGNLGAAPHRRQRDYHPDALVAVVLTLKASSDAPTARAAHPEPDLNDLASALDWPARPLFIGRKPCLPSAPLRERLPRGGPFLIAPTAHAALTQLERLGSIGQASADRARSQPSTLKPLRAQWPHGEGPAAGADVDRTLSISDRRNWMSGLHGGSRLVVEGSISPLPSAKRTSPCAR